MSENVLPEGTRDQLGGIVRQLHDALQSLGFDQVLHEVAQEIPDARDRLAYVGQMTEKAANQVLTLVDEAKPPCLAIAESGEALLKEGDAGPAAFGEFVRASVSHARTQHATLNDIMMTQDFQDLSGQVIQKVIGIITRTEKQLVELLMHSTPKESTRDTSAELAGPQVPDKALQQDDVDDLLASMGF